MEQAAFYEHEDRVGSLGNYLQQLVLQDKSAWKEAAYPQQSGQHRHLTLIETELCGVSNTVQAMEPGPELDHCLLEQHEGQINGVKSELADISHSIVTLDEDDIGLEDRTFLIWKAIFNSHLQIWRLLQAPSPTPHQ